MVVNQDQDDRDVDDNGNVGGFVGANQIQDMSTAGRRQSQASDCFAVYIQVCSLQFNGFLFMHYLPVIIMVFRIVEWNVPCRSQPAKWRMLH